MELRHLRYFIAVAGELSFTRAAEKLRLAQPSLTRQIQNLEEELEVLLFVRTKNQISLTEEGHSFLVDAKRLVEQSAESVKAVRRLSRGETSKLNLGYSFRFSFDLLASTLTTCYETYPEISVNLFDMSPAEQLRGLAARKIDLGFMGHRPLNVDEENPELSWECVARQDVMVVLPSGHPLAQKKEIFVLDLKPLFFVTMAEETHPGTRAWLSSLCYEAGFTPRILQDVELESGIMTFVAEGLGVTLAPAHIKKSPHAGVVFRPLAASEKAEYWVAWNRENASKALRQYIEIVNVRGSGRVGG